MAIVVVPEKSQESSRGMRRAVGADRRTAVRLGLFLLAEPVELDSCSLGSNPRPLIHGFHVATDGVTIPVAQHAVGKVWEDQGDSLKHFMPVKRTKSCPHVPPVNKR